MAFFAVTALLLVCAERLFLQHSARRFLAVLAIPAILAADYFLLIDVPRIDFASGVYRARPKRTVRHEDRDGNGGQGVDHDGASSSQTAAKQTGHETAAPDGDEDGGVVSGKTMGERIRDVLFPASPGIPHPELQPGYVTKDCAECPELVVIQAGSTLIGADAADPSATEAELPQRQMSIWPGFAIARREITNADMAAYLTDTGLKKPACDGAAGETAGTASEAAAACMTWTEASAYAAWLSTRTGRRYRLPSAVEWEYVARLKARATLRVAAAGPTVSDAEQQASDTLPVEGFGGGLAEFTTDCWRDVLALSSEASRPFQPARGCLTRVMKDGARDEDAASRRPSARRPVKDDVRSPRIGFRVLREFK